MAPAPTTGSKTGGTSAPTSIPSKPDPRLRRRLAKGCGHAMVLPTVTPGMPRRQLQQAAQAALQQIAHTADLVRRIARNHPSGAVIRLGFSYQQLGSAFAALATARAPQRSISKLIGRVRSAEQASRAAAKHAGIASCGPA